MKINAVAISTALLVAATVVGCGGDQDAADATEATDGSDGAATVADRLEPVSDVRLSAEDAAASAEESAEVTGDAMEEAGDQVAETGQEASDRAGEMADDATEQASEAVDEAAEQGEAAMASAADTMSTDDDSTASGEAGDPCVVNVDVGDSIAYSVDSISVPSSCESVTINLAHTGSLPQEAMGHNLVLAPADSLDAIGQAGMSAGADNEYVPDDDRIVAATGIIGGGESTSVTFSLDDLEDGVDYAYVCTFPGHWSVMRGPFTVE
jgi:azurin